MAVSTVPKSEFRRNDNITRGYGTVPAVEVEGVLGWAHPNGEITFREAEAIKWAEDLDRWFRTHMKDPKQLLTAA